LTKQFTVPLALIFAKIPVNDGHIDDIDA